MDRQTFKRKCRTRQLSWGTVLFEYLTPHAVRTLARCGYDWLWIDNEHSVHSYETIQGVVRTAEDVGIMTIVRVPQCEYTHIARAYDMGVSGVIVPRVDTPEQARLAVDSAKFPPVGKRGFGLRPCILGKSAATMAERIEDQNDRRVLFIQLESPGAVEQADAILDATDGQVDGIIFGPADFQMSAGMHDDFDAPEVQVAARRVAGVCEARSIATGVPTFNAEKARQWRDLGFTLITVGNDDAFLGNAARDTHEQLLALGEE